ncbi:MAG TPA: GTP-binding protein [Burkholderiales bacterium]|nr:GTP-binding protein [Burkholderiales bacterium]
MSELRGPPLDRRALSAAVSRAARASVREVLAAPAVVPADSGARRIGVTGAPGAGKSTLIGRLVAHRVSDARPMAVLAIDPTSPRSGGSILGDRVRMDAVSADPRVYIRSLPSAGAGDGLTDNVPEILAALDAFGFREVLVETVGVGQAQHGVRALAEVEMLVLMPGAGDALQAMKAGIMETADLYVVNKADLPGAERLEAELAGVLQHRAVRAPVVRVAAGDERGIAQLSETLDRLLEARSGAESRAARDAAYQRFRVESLLHRRLREVLAGLPPERWRRPLQEIYRDVVSRLG